MKSVVGLHAGPGGNPTGLGDWMRLLDSKSIPFSLKSVDHYGHIYEAAQIKKASGVPHVLVFRLSDRKGGFTYDTPPYKDPKWLNNPTGAADYFWSVTLAALPPEFDKQHVILEVGNEVDKLMMAWLAVFYLRILELAERDSYMVAIFGWAGGEPEYEQLIIPEMKPLFAKLVSKPKQFFISAHEYSFMANHIRTRKNEAGGFEPAQTFEEGQLIGRIFNFFTACRHFNIATNPKVLVSECGWAQGDLPSPEVAIKHIDELSHLYNHPDIVGAFLWYLGGGFKEIATKAQRIIKPLGEYIVATDLPDYQSDTTEVQRQPDASGNYLLNGDFSQGLRYWSIASVGTYNLEGAALKYTVPAKSYIRIKTSVELSARRYRLKFQYSSMDKTPVLLTLSMNDSVLLTQALDPVGSAPIEFYFVAKQSAVYTIMIVLSAEMQFTGKVTNFDLVAMATEGNPLPAGYFGQARSKFTKHIVLWPPGVPKSYLLETRRIVTDMGINYDSTQSADAAAQGVYVDETGKLAPLPTNIVIVNPSLWGNDPHGTGRGITGYMDTYYPHVDYFLVEGKTAVECAQVVLAALSELILGQRNFQFSVYPLNVDKFSINQGWAARPDYYKQFDLLGHEGVDLFAPDGTVVFAVAPGIIKLVYTNPKKKSDGGHNYGIHVRVSHPGYSDGDWETVYAHLKSVSVAEGQVVKAGHKLGLADSTGNSDGSHLHLTLFNHSHDYIDQAGNWGKFHDPTRFLIPFFTPQEPPAPTPAPVPTPVPRYKALVGLHASADGGAGSGHPAEIPMFKLLGDPILIKFLSINDGHLMAPIIAEHPKSTYVIRPYVSFQDSRGIRDISPQQFYTDTIADIVRAMNFLRSYNIPEDRIYIEIHNEPNLYMEGLSKAWNNGTQFSSWVRTVRSLYDQAFPLVRYLFPGLSPGGDHPNVRYDSIRFMEEIVKSGVLADFDAVGVHLYWAPNNPLTNELAKLDNLISRFFKLKPIIITEASYKFSNDPRIMASQYATFITALRAKYSTVLGVSFYVASATNSEFDHEVWIKKGRSTGLAEQLVSLLK